VTDEAAMQQEPRKSRRMLWLWLGAFLFLGLIGAFCLLVLKPYLEVREAIGDGRGHTNILRMIECGDWRVERDARVEHDGREIIARLGGPRAAARNLIIYSKLPNRRDPDNRKYAAACERVAVGLMGFCESEAVARLVDLLKSEDPLICVYAVNALGYTGDPRAVEPLIAALGNPDGNMRFSATVALGRIGGNRAVEALIALFKDKELRWWAAMTLGKTHDERALAPLLVALGDQDSPQMRRWAARGLGFLGDQRAIPALEALAARETDKDVVQAAREAIENIRGANVQAHPGNDEKPKPGGR